jgi:hypothetical protein
MLIGWLLQLQPADVTVVQLPIVVAQLLMHALVEPELLHLLLPAHVKLKHVLLALL